MAKNQFSQKGASCLRKIQRKEASRYANLPLFWLASAGLDAGDYVEYTIGPNMELIVRPAKIDGGHNDDF